MPAKKRKCIVLPPVKIGDKAYFVINGDVYRAEICLIEHRQTKNGVWTEIRGSVNSSHSVSARFEDWGKTVFATMTDARDAILPRYTGPIYRDGVTLKDIKRNPLDIHCR